MVDARRAARTSARRTGAGGLRAVELAGGRRIDCDLLVTAAGWTAPTSLLTMAGDRPVYSPRAARFVPEPAGLARTAPTCSRPAGSPGTAAWTSWSSTRTRPGREAARRALGRRCAVGRPGRERRRCRRQWRAGRCRASHPELFHGGTHGFVDFSEDVVVQGHADRRRGGVRLGRAGQAVHHGHDGPDPGQARDGQHHRGPRRGRPGATHRRDRDHDLAAAVRAGDAGRARRPGHRAGAVLADAALARARTAPSRWSPGQWIRPDHYGDPAAEVRPCAAGGRDHRRDPDRQARPARSGRRRSCSTCCTSTSGPSSPWAGSGTA